jgi:hypothetical protein
MLATIWDGKWLNDCPLKVTGVERGGSGGGSRVEVEGTLRSSGDPRSRWRRSWCRIACWWRWCDEEEESGGGGDNRDGGGGVVDMRKIAAAKWREGEED